MGKDKYKIDRSGAKIGDLIFIDKKSNLSNEGLFMLDIFKEF